jgi:hypothetical protein
MLLPERVTPHTLRRTFASLAFMAGRDPRWVMGQIGDTDPRLTLSVYAQVMQRPRIDFELVWSLMRFSDEPDGWVNGTTIGTTSTSAASPMQSAALSQEQELQADAGDSEDGRGWFRTSDLSRVKRALSH